MELRTIPYRDEYRRQCIDLMSDTWNHNTLFPGLTRENLVNELFFHEATVGATYSRIILDENDRVAGYLFGILKNETHGRLSRGLRTVGLIGRMVFHFLAGHLGPRRRAWRTATGLLSMMSALEGKRQDSDGFVSLFFVASSLRGLGWGKRLMEDFQHHCEAQGCRRIYLWTDKGCNYHFYDRQGFQRVVEVSSPLLAGYGDEPNGFTYVKSLATGCPHTPFDLSDAPGYH